MNDINQVAGRGKNHDDGTIEKDRRLKKKHILGIIMDNGALGDHTISGDTGI
jgi:hypothetical protein